MAGDTQPTLPAPALPAPYLPDHFRDAFSRLPYGFFRAGHTVAEALQPLGGSYGTPFTAASVLYIGLAAFQRSSRAGDAELNPELMKRARMTAAVDSVGTTWLEGITLPSILMGGVNRAVASAWAGAPVGARAAAALAASPLVLAASSHGAEALMDWAFRPAIGYFSAAPPVAFRSSEFVPPPAEELLSGSPDLMLLSGDGKDPLARARLEWALDGDAGSAFPEEVDVKEGKREGGEAAYLDAVASIRLRAALRVHAARAEQEEAGKKKLS
jgi:hypothetical protein